MIRCQLIDSLIQKGFQLSVFWVTVLLFIEYVSEAMAFGIFQRGVLVGGEKSCHRTRKLKLKWQTDIAWKQLVIYVEVAENLESESTHTTPVHISLWQSAHNYSVVYTPVWRLYSRLTFYRKKWGTTWPLVWHMLCC